MSIRKALIAVAASSLLFSFFGGLAGFLIGKAIPGYYRSVFYGGDAPQFDPVQVELGQGITQGMVGGAVAVIAIVGLVAWHDIRAKRR